MLNLVDILGLPFLACITILVITGYLGIHVLMREVIFIDIALAQVAAVGAVVAHVAFGAHGDSIVAYACAFGATVIAAAFYSIVRGKVAHISLEAIIGITYSIAMAAALFVLGVAPGGHLHVQQILAGSILWAKWADVAWCAVAFSGVGLCFYLFRTPFMRISEDYERARAEGLRVVLWDFVFYALLGVVITLAVRIAGVVVVFAFLIIPATISALFTPRLGTRLVIAWGCGGVASLIGLLFSYYLDFSVGPAVALFLGLLVALAASAGVLRARILRTAGGAGKHGCATRKWVL
jgi:zinc/manganese transport system permease protein